MLFAFMLLTVGGFLQKPGNFQREAIEQEEKRHFFSECLKESTSANSLKNELDFFETKSIIDGDRFTLAQDRTFTAFSKVENLNWSNDFYFIQMADTQFGFLQWAQDQGFYNNHSVKETREEAYQAELDFANRSVEIINAMQPRPEFVVVCGDMVQAWPQEEELQAKQNQDFKMIFAKVHPDIHLMCTCGNHDVGNRPTSKAIQTYKKNYGDDYYTFWIKGVQIVVLNSQLIKCSEHAEEDATQQEEWFKRTIAERKRFLEGRQSSSQPDYFLVFSHIPPFHGNVNEEESNQNFSLDRRNFYLEALESVGCDAWFAGHTHFSSVKSYNDMEIVVTGAIGTNLIEQEDDDRNWFILSEEQSGFRKVQVTAQGVSHQYHTLSEFSTSNDQHGQIYGTDDPDRKDTSSTLAKTRENPLYVHPKALTSGFQKAQKPTAQKPTLDQFGVVFHGLQLWFYSDTNRRLLPFLIQFLKPSTAERASNILLLTIFICGVFAVWQNSGQLFWDFLYALPFFFFSPHRVASARPNDRDRRENGS